MTVPPLRLVQQRARQRPERAIQAAVTTLLRAHGCLVWPMQRERARERATHIGFRGMPDLFGALPDGRAFFLEVKRPGQRPTAEQRRALEILARQHTATGWVTSVEAARDWLVIWGVRK